MVLATQAWFDAVNAQGGVRGRQLRAVAFDDGDRLDASVKRVQRLVYMLSVMGTQSAMRALGACAAGPVSFIGLQPYINTKVLLEGLRCAGRDLSRSRAVQALESLRRLDIGGGARWTTARACARARSSSISPSSARAGSSPARMPFAIHHHSFDTLKELLCWV